MFKKLTQQLNWKRVNKDPHGHIILVDVRITKIEGEKHTLMKIIRLAKGFPTQATKIG